MITIYVDPTDGNQVMAYYRDCQPGNPSVWMDQGYIETVVADTHPLYRDLIRHQRNCQFTDVACTPRANPVQPVPNPAEDARRAARASARGKLKGMGLTDEELAAMGF